MLRKKLFRTMGRYKAQFISMVIMVALGIGVFLGFQMEWYTLDRNSAKTYEATGFADYRILSESFFTREELEAVAAIPGVFDATRFLRVNVAVKGDTDLLGLSVSSNPKVSGIFVTSGEDYDPSGRGFWLSDQYAAKNGVRLRDRLTLVYAGPFGTVEITAPVLGLAKASEYMICLQDETQIMPDYNSYGFVYMSPALLRESMGIEAYTQINLTSDLSKEEIVPRIDKALGRTSLVLSKDEVVSWAETQGEIEEGITMGSILPVLFLAIAILTMVTTMHRLTASEKTQIGLLKSLGFQDSRILRHYSAYGLTIGLAGSVLGVGIGCLLAWYIMNPEGAMGTYVDLIDWALYVPSFCWIVLAAVIGFLTLISFLSVKSMLRGSAADALRPYSPKRVRPLPLEGTGFWKRMRFSGRWNLRDSLRHKSRTGMTLFGIIGCMVLLVGALGMNDTARSFVTVFYDEATAYESKLNLSVDETGNEAALALAEARQGDWAAVSSVQVGEAPVGLEIYHVPHGLIRFIGKDMSELSLSPEGVYICDRIARDNGLAPGDRISFSPYGSSETYEATVQGILRSLSESVILSDEAADRLGIPYSINTVYTRETGVEAGGVISSVQSKQSILQSFDKFMELMNTMILLLVAAAVVLGLVVLYNLGIMSYTERYREMATLKVVGFRDRQIGRILIGQNLWLTVLGVVIGLPAGVGVLQYLLTALASDYEMKLTLGPITYAVSILLTFGVSLLVGWMIARRTRSIDMVESLKGVD
jgi:putative ABC transport system permease protein